MQRAIDIFLESCLTMDSYMTDGSGVYHMKYNVYYADRLGEESGRAGFFMQ